MPRKIIFFLIDGLADPLSEKTPLKLAKKPRLNNELLNKSFLCQFYPLKKENWPKYGSSSATGLANLGILGYDLKPEKIKRGPLEALGLGINYKKGELALRVDFATVNNNLIVIDRRAGRETFGLTDLERAINALLFPEPFHFHRTYGHRGVLIFRKKLSQYISDADPYETNKKVKKIRPLKNNYLSLKTAKIVQDFLDKTFYLLNNHPINNLRQKKGMLKANYLLSREAGNSLPKLKNFFKKFNLKNGLVIAENGAVKATCLLAGFKSFTLPEIKSFQKRYSLIKKTILEYYYKYSLVYVHLKEADEASHDKNFQKKKEYFEFFDNWLYSLMKSLPSQTIIVITGDHITNSYTGKHLYGPLPLLIINHPKPNNMKEFAEIEAKNSKITFLPEELWKNLSLLSRTNF